LGAILQFGEQVWQLDVASFNVTVSAPAFLDASTPPLPISKYPPCAIAAVSL
jgi:hypothetical protein